MASRTVAEHARRPGYEAQRAEILAAAAVAIAEHGYHGMSMRELARATGRALANFYNYFSSKEDVLFSLQTDAFETMTKSAKAALEEVDEPVERLYIFILNHLRFLVDHQSVMRVLVHEASALPPGRRKTIRLLKEGYFNLCKEIVASILSAGCNSAGASGAPSLDPMEVERVTYSVFGMLNWSYSWYAPKQHGTPEDVAKSIHGLAVCGLVARCPHRLARVNLERFLGATAPPPLIANADHAEAQVRKRASPAEKNTSRGNARKTLQVETQPERGPEKCVTEK